MIFRGQGARHQRMPWMSGRLTTLPARRGFVTLIRVPPGRRRPNSGQPTRLVSATVFALTHDVAARFDPGLLLVVIYELYVTPDTYWAFLSRLAPSEPR